MRSTKQQIGEWGEKKSSDFMAVVGYEHPARNVLTQQGVIDIVAESEDATHFAKVRILTSDRITRSEETITRRKQSHPLAAVEAGTQLHHIGPWQINAISVEGQPGSKPPAALFKIVLG